MKKLIVNKIFLFRKFHQKGFFHLLSANVLIQVVAFASQLFVAGILAPDDLGRIKIIQTYLSIFSIVAGMGFNSSTLKLCSENRSPAEQNSLFKSALYFTILSTLSIYFIVLILNYFQIFSKDKLIIILIPLGLFPIISNSIFLVFISYFQATKKIIELSNLTIVNKLIAIIAIIILTYYFGIKGYYIAYNLSFIIMLVVCYKTFQSVIFENFSLKINIAEFNIHWHYAKSSMFANAISVISAYIDILLIGFFVPDMEQIGFYSFALTLIVVIRLIPSTVQQIATPYFSSLSHKKEEFIIVFKRYNRILYWVVFISLISVWIFVPFMTHYIFKGKYDESMQYFFILSLGWSIRQLTQLQSGAIFGLGKMHYIVYSSLISLTLNILVFSLAIFYFGLMGSAFASIFSGIITLLTSYIYFKKALNEIDLRQNFNLLD